MYRRDYDSRAGFAAGILTGALVGAGVALLLAPRSGAQLREEMGESWGTLRDAVGQRYRDLAERAGVELSNFNDRVDQVAQAVETRAHDFINAAAHEARDASSRMNNQL